MGQMRNAHKILVCKPEGMKSEQAVLPNPCLEEEEEEEENLKEEHLQDLGLDGG
jgi:hypothetical protein